jgi:glycine cleavage system regulatory protein
VTAESRRTVAAFDGLVEALLAAASDIDWLVERSRRASQVVASGQSLTDYVSAEERPLIITRMTELLDRLSDAAAEVRRAEAHQLRAEGLSHERIAQLFGVTRQRAAALLAPPPSPEARAAKRPHRRDG